MGRILVLSLVGVTLDGFEAQSVFGGLVRLVDKALGEHRAARVAIQRLVDRDDSSGFPLFLLFRGIEHAETCIDAADRAARHATELCRLPEILPLIRSSAQPPVGHVTTVRRLRNALQHTEERIIEQRLQPGQPTIPLLTDTSIVLGPDALPFSALEALISWQHELVVEILDHLDTQFPSRT
jgi:hypothetical protein